MKKLLFALGLAASLAPTAALAGNSFEDHKSLVRTLQSKGVQFVINHSKFCVDSAGGGMYTWQYGQPMMIVCQDGGKPGGQEVRWTANDLDTIRHEAHHIVQDCLDGQIADGELQNMLIEDTETYNRVIAALGKERADRIIQSYREMGADDETIVIELEAFAVATHVEASQIEQAVERYCFY